ncbi:MAG: type II toxin-antitoxin system VapC family toxin [Thermoanaerobaculia bacterium]
MLSWLLGEARSGAIREQLGSAELILASELTLIECDRVLIRATKTEQLTEAQAGERRLRLEQAAQHWTLLSLDSEIVERARRPFPDEPVRTLDAIHLATAVMARGLVPKVALLSLDEKIRRNGALLGFELLPKTD